MAKEPAIKSSGVVIECLPNEHFSVKLENSEHIITAYIAGNIRKNQIRILVGDRVNVDITPYDPKKGRISFRGK